MENRLKYSHIFSYDVTALQKRLSLELCENFFLPIRDISGS
jgi:hypothetical protein